MTTKPAELDQVDYTDLDPNGAGAAGALVSTTADLATFTRELIQGRLVRPDLLTIMLTPFDRNAIFLYGLGAQTINARCPAEYVGHFGTVPGFATFAATTLDGRRQVVIMLTNAPDTTPALEQAVRALIDRLLCPSGSGPRYGTDPTCRPPRPSSPPRRALIDRPMVLGWSTPPDRPLR